MTAIQDIETFWMVVGKVAAVIALLVGLVQGISYLHTKLPSGKLEKRVDKIEELQKRDFEHFKKIDGRLDNLEKDSRNTQEQLKQVNDGIQRIGKSQIALLRHNIDGNGIDKMREEADDLTEFFIDR